MRRLYVFPIKHSTIWPILYLFYFIIRNHGTADYDRLLSHLSICLSLSLAAWVCCDSSTHTYPPLQCHFNAPGSCNAYSSKFTLFCLYRFVAYSCRTHSAECQPNFHTHTHSLLLLLLLSSSSSFYVVFVGISLPPKMAHTVFSRINIDQLIKCVVCMR